MNKINVLWMNNGDESLNQYAEEASIYNINIITCNNEADCKILLEDKSNVWDAIMINAEVKLTANLKPSIDHLGTIVKVVRDNCKDHPCYIVTTDVKLDNNNNFERKIINGIIQTGKEEFYVLKNENLCVFFESILRRVNNNPEYNVRKRYPEVCNFCTEKLIVDLLIKYEYEDINTDTEIPNQCRKILEWAKNNTIFSKVLISDKIRSELKERNKKFTDARTYNQLSLNDFSYALNKSSRIPEFVKRSLHSCISTSNPGSHYSEVHKMLECNEAPYLNRSLICELINILHWCSLQNKVTFKL
ncbi:MAG: hypothetical protein IKH26_09125 [Bacteroidaceae bacterium]|nr:hypothetical protein [Bacteroidaceae bacterium]